MKNSIYNKFDKKIISTLPQVLFQGKIVLILNDTDAKEAVDYLLSSDMLGVDTETRPTFKKGQIHKVSLLQVATKDICFLFRLNMIGINDDVKRLL